MPTYKISSEVDFGISHYGSNTAERGDDITFTPEQVATLWQIMEKAHSEGLDLMTLDLVETDLEKIDPKLLELIRNAYDDCAYKAEYDYMIEEIYSNGEYNECVPWDTVEEICREDYGYLASDDDDEYDDDDKDEYDDEDEDFKSWFRREIVDSGKIIDFEHYYNLLDMSGDFHYHEGAFLIPAVLVREFLDSLPQK
ncbi:MAG: hypothetical protein K2G29_07870 [Muribaculaceae bacterium]|nr:hypothetical protein [Muribaculaceae bacterium]